MDIKPAPRPFSGSEELIEMIAGNHCYPIESQQSEAPDAGHWFRDMAEDLADDEEDRDRTQRIERPVCVEVNRILQRFADMGEAMKVEDDLENDGRKLFAGLDTPSSPENA